MHIFLTGATGLVGQQLLPHLRTHTVTAVSRSPNPAMLKPPVRVVTGDPAAPGEWQQALRGCHTIIALAGEPLIGKRWSPAVKERLRNSRIHGMQQLYRALQRLPLSERPTRLISASAVGYYGNTGDEPCTESTPPGQDFLAQLCVDWEAAAQACASLAVQVIPLRIGIVLARGGGALSSMLPWFRLGVGGPIGSGHQYLSWIHIDDLVRLILFCMNLPAHPPVGPLNATAPNPVSMEEFASILGRTLQKPSWLRVPAFGVRALFGEGADALLNGQRVLPQKAEQLGFSFQYPTLRSALENLLR